MGKQLNTFEKEFIKFLKENNAYEAFCESLKYNNIQGSVDGYIRHVFVNIISYAFLWGHTPQGVGYWCDLHNKWKDYISNKKPNTMKERFIAFLKAHKVI